MWRLTLIWLVCALGCAEGVRTRAEGDAAGSMPDAGGPCVERPEQCNAVDDDCDGMIDEGLARACADAADGCAAREQTCTLGVWSLCPERELGAEQCNGADDDCDGVVDEGLRRACGTTVGICEIGSERCNAGAWVGCDAVGEVGGMLERCGDETDEDCDGTVDEGCACADGQRRPCGETEGRCEAGEQACVMGVWTRCEGALLPGPERCDGVDDDCDGAVDEDLFRDCGTEVGVCAPGMALCIDGDWSDCVDSIDPAPETCDGRDEDCDGGVDEGLSEPCGIDIGTCISGERRCERGEWGACVGSAEPRDEVCDGAGDEDCDGTVDEGCDCVDGQRRPCGIDTGACERGEQVCQGGGWRACQGAVEPGTEVCDGRIDEDCDGAVDERCQCVNGATRACGNDVGACRLGQETCAAGRWGACAGGRGPAGEICGQGVDEDCDGTVDEGFRARVIQTTYTALARNHELCDGSFQRHGDNCMSAFHRRCNADCTRSGLGPIENNNDNAAGVCVASIGAQTTFAVLSGINGNCRVGSVFNEHCNQAIDQHCRNMGHAGGFGPVEHAGDNAFISCVPAATTERLTVTFAQLSARHPPCNAQRRFGPDCSAAIHRECAGRGFVSGHGPLRIQGDRVDVMCFRR